MTDQISVPESPKWGQTTKMVIGLTVIAILVFLFIQFREIVGPLILAFILAYFFHPLAARLSKAVRIPWRAAVNLIYLILIIVLVGIFTALGFAIVQQTQSLVSFVQRFVSDLPNIVADISTQSYKFGPFVLDFSHLDLTAIANELLGVLQPLLGKAGGLVSTVATSAVSTIGWGFFVLMISYFLLNESGQVPERLVSIEIPGYNADTLRLGHELGHIWGAFLRGQLLISLLVMIAYTVLLTILGVRFTLAIALMAGVAGFIPWVGPALTWLTVALVAFLQPGNYFGLAPLKYAFLVLVACLLLNQIFDNLISPRLMGRTLGVHPAGVLIAAIVVTKLIGFVGLMLAAPVLATLNLLSRYIVRKMFDQNPWPEEIKEPETIEHSWTRLLHRLGALKRYIRRR